MGRARGGRRGTRRTRDRGHGGTAPLDDPERGDGVKRALFRDPDDEDEEEAGRQDWGGAGAARHDGTWRSAGAVAVGVVHGAAGPGAVLGVLPAVALRRSSLVFGYFAGFCVATVATMGAFAASYGEVTSRLGDAHGARVRSVLRSSAPGRVSRLASRRDRVIGVGARRGARGGVNTEEAGV